MNSQTTEKHHHHHHEPGSRRHKKRSSKSTKSSIPSNQTELQQNDSANTFENQPIPHNISNDTYPNSDNDNYQHDHYHVFTIDEMESLTTEKFKDRMLRDIRTAKKLFFNSIKDKIQDYVNTVNSNHNMNFQNNNNRNMGGFSYDDNFDNNNYNYHFHQSDDNFGLFPNDAKNTTKNTTNNINDNNIIGSDGSYHLVNDDLDDTPKSSDPNTNDLFNDTNDNILNINKSKNDSLNNDFKVIQTNQDPHKKKRKKKIKNTDINTSSNTTNTTNNMNTSNLFVANTLNSSNTTNITNNINASNLVDNDSKEEGEISPNFSIDSLDDSNAPNTTTPKNNNFDLSNKFDIIEEESVNDAFSSEGNVITHNSNRPALNNNNSKKIKLFDFDALDKNDDNPSAFSDVI